MIKTHPVAIANETFSLAGNLVLPEGASPQSPVPGAVILGGPGPVPLQRYSPEGARQWPVLWSEALGGAGLAAICYDQRGSGLSTGLYHVADWADLYEDAKAMTETLRAQPEVGKIAAIAWADACPYGLKLAAAGLVDALVLMAPPYYTAQERYARTVARLAKSRGLSERVVKLRTAQWLAEVQAQERLLEQGDRYDLTDLGGKSVPTNRDRFVQVTRLDPAPLVAVTRVPVLLQHGEEDPVIPPQESEAMAAALPGERDRITYPGQAHFLYRHARAMVDAAGWLGQVLG